MVTRRGPRGKYYCVLCNPGGYGKVGEDGTEAIAEYYIDPTFNDPPTGWQPICEYCLTTVHWTPEFARTLRPLDGYEDHPFFNEDEPAKHTCKDFRWEKQSLVTEEGGFDWVECSECGARAKRRGLGRIEVVEVPSDIEGTEKSDPPTTDTDQSGGEEA